MIAIMMRTCKVCNVSKSFDEYPVRKWTTAKGAPRSGPRFTCFPCQRDLDNARYNAPGSKKRASKLAHDAANQEAKRAYRSQYYQANRDKWLNKVNGWRSSDRAKAYDREYRAKNAARLKLIARAWREANKPQLLAKTRARQAKVRRATPAWSDPAMILEFYKTAARMSVLTGRTHHVDHYYPLVSDVVCGLHVPANLRVIPAEDNVRKLNKMPE